MTSLSTLAPRGHTDVRPQGQSTRTGCRRRLRCLGLLMKDVTVWAWFPGGSTLNKLPVPKLPGHLGHRHIAVQLQQNFVLVSAPLGVSWAALSYEMRDAMLGLRESLRFRMREERGSFRGTEPSLPLRQQKEKQVHTRPARRSFMERPNS